VDPRDDDIEFDFFEEEPATTEAQPPQPRGRLPRRGGRGGGNGDGGGGASARRPPGPPHGMTPFLRLLGAAVVLVVLLVLFGVALESCAGTSKHDQYSSYVNDAGKIAKSSQDDGTAVANALTTPGAKASEIASNLDGIAESERQNLAAAQKLDPPGPIRPENQQMIESLQLRISGVEGMAKTLSGVTSKSSTSDTAAALADQAQRLTASDIVWSDLFQTPANEEMANQGVKGVSAPSSQFVANDSLVAEKAMNLLLQRLHGAATGAKPTGLHGSALIGVSAVSNGNSQVLSQSAQNTVTATTDLGFVVTIQDSGDFQELRIKVTLTIQQSPAIVKTLTIPVINPGEKKSVTFKNLGAVKFAHAEQLQVDVAAVPGEANLDNNKGTYPVIFSLG